ncbi:hypothetical protein Ancab_001304 [Ancistrocladus abbreviatus]
MEMQEEATTGCSNKEQAQMIVKGKRTKRQRPQSPIPFRIPQANSSKSDEESSDVCSNIQDTSNTNNQVNSVANPLQPTSPSDDYNYRDSTTEEEEDMANCLILLAQGQSRHQSLSPKHQAAGQGQETGHKFNSRKLLMEAGTGKTGYYVYECKTCSKTFPSFQALGGHRASHKKPKIKEEDKRQATFLLSDDEDSPHISSSLSLQLNNRGLFNNNCHGGNLSKPRVHECSICGAEFASGQALGGHMRRHRGPVGGGGSQAINTTTTTTLSLTPMMNIDNEHLDRNHQLEEKRLVVPSTSPSPSSAAKNNVLSLDLDLNLPAPEDDHRESKFHFASKQPEEQPPPTQTQQQLVFSPPTLVGCHY